MAAYATTAITINDFKPGIMSDYHAALTETAAETTTGAFLAPGIATIDGTFRCCADRTGALMPLPRLIDGKSSARKPIADNGNGKYLTNMASSYLLDATLLTDMFVEGTQASADVDRAAVFTMYGQWYQTDLYRWTVLTTMHRLYESAGAEQDLMWAKGASSLLVGEAAQAHIGGGNFTTFRARYLIDSLFTIQAMAWVAYGSPGYSANPPDWVTGAISPAEQALTTFDDANGATYPAYSSFRILGLFPNYSAVGATNDATSRFLTIAGFTAAHILTTHQGRLIGASRDHGVFGENIAGSALGNITEHVHYTPPFDFDASLGIGALEFGTFGETKPYLSGIVYSVTAEDLLLIKDQGGGVLVRGDLSNPTIIALPFVHSTHGVRSIPVNTPSGLFYGTRNGVYVWTGGENTSLASQQLDGFFWNHDTEGREYLGSRGRFAWWEPFVAVPNNFLMDTRHGSWWRLDEVTSSKVAYNCYDVAPSSNRLYAFPWKLDSTNQMMWRTATPATLATTYSWKSQPLAGTAERVVSIKDVRLLATPAGTASTITVTLSGFSQTGAAVTPVSVSLALAANNRPQQVNKLVTPNFVASYVQVKIEADGGAGPAPKVHALTVGLVERARRPNQ